MAPEYSRTPLGDALSAALLGAEFSLQTCADCGAVQYPPREVCGACLSEALEWRPVSPAGTLESWTAVHISLDPWFQSRAPWPICSVKLAAGPAVIAHLAIAAPSAGLAVSLARVSEGNGGACLAAVAADSPFAGRLISWDQLTSAVPAAASS